MDEQSQQSTSTSIRWTRKAAVIQKRPLRLFDEDEQIDESLVDDAEVDWLTGTKRARAGALEDAKTKADRLQKEGAQLAEAEHFIKAIHLFHESLQLWPEQAHVWDMKAQALVCINEDFAAIQSAQEACSRSHQTPTYYRTLARAYYNFGELSLAVTRMQYALLLDPNDLHLRAELMQMLRTKQDLQSGKLKQTTAETTISGSVVMARNLLII